MKLVNLTPHKIVLISPEGERTELSPEGLARVDSHPGVEVRNPNSWCRYCNGTYPEDRGEPGCSLCWGSNREPFQGPVALYEAPTWGEVEGLPAPKKGIIYIVSALVAERCLGREDVYSPGTGPRDGAVRNAQGQVEAVTRLIQARQSFTQPGKLVCSHCGIECEQEAWEYEGHCPQCHGT